MIRRRADWQTRLVAYLAAVRATPFAYGRHDCALFVAGAVEAMTDIDVAEPWLGRYTTRAGGMRILRREGHADHVALVASLLPEVLPGLANPGDVIVVDQTALGLAQGRFAYVLTDLGLGLRPMEDATRAFRV